MKEITLYGLGGQGVVVAAHILTQAAGVHESQYAQSIPAFSAEQRGAPVHAYVRLSDQPVLPHCYVYEPDCIVSFLYHATPWNQLITSNRRTTICVNLPLDQSRELEELGLCGGFVDADQITHEVLGRGTPPNAAMLGVFAATTGWISLDSLRRAMLDFWPDERGEKNALAARIAFERTIKF